MEKKEKKIRLSIGIIFKNEIRCLERCLKSLEPLRKALPCELVMADTGSDDGSREIAEKYADILFDFPWINDFAAARNAVMDRCSGEWYFSVDADEWLDEDIKELVSFMNSGGRHDWDACGLTERNFYSYDYSGHYSTFIPWRFLRMATGRRFQGAIHENWGLSGTRNYVLQNTVLYHDGYVEMNRVDSSSGKEKRERNMALLREKLEDDPRNLISYMQFLESGVLESDYGEKLSEALSLIEERVTHWNTVGASILRYAVTHAIVKKLPEPELEELVQKAEDLVINSYFIRMDAAFNLTIHYHEREEYEKCAHWGDIALRAYEDYRAGRGDLTCQIFSPLQNSAPIREETLKIVVSRAYFKTDRADEAVALLDRINCTELDGPWTGNLLETMLFLHYRGVEGMASLIGKVWEDIQAPVPNEERANKRKENFLSTGARRFDPDEIKMEPVDPAFRRYMYTLFTPLKGKCYLGAAAAILESNSPAEMEELLDSAEAWEDLPTVSLSHALRAGVRFPIDGWKMNIEEMDLLASRLAKDPEGLHEILTRAAGEDFTGSWQALAWVRGLAMAAVRTYDWEDEDAGMRLSQVFVKAERAFIAGCYAPEVLREGNLFVLPPMHRFGWYCVQAFDALEVGDTVGYARFLREALTVNQDMKKMVEFLTKHTPELQAPPPAPELLELAEKVRMMLAAYPADDPAVAVLKASPVYQRVAYLIEGEDT